MKNNFKINLFILLSIIQIKESLSLFTLKKEASSIILHSKLSSLFKKPFNTFCLNNKNQKNENIDPFAKELYDEYVKALFIKRFWSDMAQKSSKEYLYLIKELGNLDNNSDYFNKKNKLNEKIKICVHENNHYLKCLNLILDEVQKLESNQEINNLNEEEIYKINKDNIKNYALIEEILNKIIHNF